MLIHSDPNNMNSIVYHLIIEIYSMKTLHWYFPWATALHLYNMTGRGEKLQQLHCYHPFSDSLDIYLTKNHYENYSPKMVPIVKIWGSGSWTNGSATLDIDGHRVHSKFQVLDSGKPGCTNHSCMYGGGLGAIDHDYIYDCKQCFGLASSSICARCLIYGGTCEPDHNAWVLVTWKLFSWTADILLIYQRPTFHSWIPEWRTIFFFFFI